MRQIGDLVGVSQSTVSRVLSGAPSVVPVAPETRERILKLVAELGYVPNPLARALRSSRTGLLGLIVRDINDPFFAAAIAAITAEARAREYSVVLGHADSSADKAIALRELLAVGHCEGALLLGDLRDQAVLWTDASEHGIPLVGLWQGARESHIPVVNVDNAEGIRLAIDHLMELGHRRIGFLQGGRTGDGLERGSAFVDYMETHGLAVRAECINVADNNYAATTAAADELLACAERPTAIMCSTDVAAVGALKAAHERGLRVPEDLSVVGFDDIPLAGYTIPALTTIRQPMRELSERAIALLIERITEPADSRARLVTVAPTLVVRHSTGLKPGR